MDYNLYTWLGHAWSWAEPDEWLLFTEWGRQTGQRIERGRKDDGGAAEPRKLSAGWVGRRQGHFVGRTWGDGGWQLLAEGR